MNDWTLFESAMIFILILGVPMIVAISVIFWNFVKKMAWFIRILIDGVIWRAEYIHGIKFKRRSRK